MGISGLSSSISKRRFGARKYGTGSFPAPQPLASLLGDFSSRPGAADAGPPVLVIDGAGWQHFMMKLYLRRSADVPFPSLFGVDVAAYASAVARFAEPLLQLGLDLHFVWDGSAAMGDSSKSLTKLARFESRLEEYATLQAYCESGEVPVVKRVGDRAGGVTAARWYEASSPHGSPLAGDASDAVAAHDSRLAVWEETEAKLRVHLSLLNRAEKAAFAELAAAWPQRRIYHETVIGEADSRAAQLCALNPLRVVAVLAQDTDYCIFEGCRYLSFEDLFIPGLAGVADMVASPSSPGGGEGGGSGAIIPAPLASPSLVANRGPLASILTPAAVAGMLRVPPRLLPDLSILCGNDYTKPLLWGGSRGDTPTDLTRALGWATAKWVDEAAPFLSGRLCDCATPSAAPGSAAAGLDWSRQTVEVAGRLHVCTALHCRRPVHVEGLMGLEASEGGALVPGPASPIAGHPDAAALIKAMTFSRLTYACKAPSAAVAIVAAVRDRLLDRPASEAADVPYPPIYRFVRESSAVAQTMALVALKWLPSGVNSYLKSRISLEARGQQRLVSAPFLLTKPDVMRPIYAIMLALAKGALPWMPSSNDTPDASPPPAVLHADFVPGVPGGLLAVPLRANPDILRTLPGWEPPPELVASLRALELPAMPPVVLLRAAPRAVRGVTFLRAAHTAVFSWCADGFGRPPVRLAPDQAEQLFLQDKSNEDVTHALERLFDVSAAADAVGTQTCPWASASLAAAFKDPAADAAALASALAIPGAAFNAQVHPVLALRHLIAMVGNAFAAQARRAAGDDEDPEARAAKLQLAASQLPTLQELAAIIAMLALLGCPSLPRPQSDVIHVLARPALRSITVAGWYQTLLSELARLGSALGVGIKRKAGASAAGDEEEEADDDEDDDDAPSPVDLVGMATSKARLLKSPEAKAAFTQVLGDAHGVWSTLQPAQPDASGTELGVYARLPRFDPAAAYDGRLLHSMLQGLGPNGGASGARDAGVGSAAAVAAAFGSEGVSALAALLPASARALLAQHAGAAERFTALWQTVLAPFEAAAVLSGFAAIAAAVSGEGDAPAPAPAPIAPAPADAAPAPNDAPAPGGSAPGGDTPADDGAAPADNVDASAGAAVPVEVEAAAPAEAEAAPASTVAPSAEAAAAAQSEPELPAAVAPVPDAPAAEAAPAPTPSPAAQAARKFGLAPTSAVVTSPLPAAPEPVPAAPAPAPAAPEPLHPGMALPTAAHRLTVLQAVACHTVAIVKGDTGSGKSTQVPQMILDAGARVLGHPHDLSSAANPAPPGVTVDSLCGVSELQGGEGTLPAFMSPDVWGDREPRIFVTQPRRVAAVSVAKRVADERRSKLGEVVGYRIGNERVSGKNTRITFVTTGWMLQWLVATTNELMAAEEAASEEDIAAAAAAAADAAAAAEEEEGEERVGDVIVIGAPSGPSARSSGAGDAHARRTPAKRADTLEALAAASGDIDLATHVVLDEIHERGIDTDLVCLVIKTVIQAGMLQRVRTLAAMRKLLTGGEAARSQAEISAILEEQGRRLFARRLRLVLMSATFDTGPFTEYFIELARSHAVEVEKALRPGADKRRLKALLPTGVPDPAIEAALAKSVLASAIKAGTHAAALPPLPDMMASDIPATLYVGAKRFPVKEVFLEDVYGEGPAMDIPALELSAIGNVTTRFDREAAGWRDMVARTGNKGAAAKSLGEVAALDDRQRASLLRLAARLALKVARFSADTVLIFVAGMQDIDATVEALMDVAPEGWISNPTAKMASRQDDVEDAENMDLEAFAARKQHILHEEGVALAGEAPVGEGGEALSEEASDALAAGATAAAAAPAGSKAAVAKAVAANLKAGASKAVDRTKIRIFPMHSLISFDDQLAAFGADEGDTRTRVVVATNIAEASVTLPMVHTVIDFGRVKTVEYVPKLKTSMLRSTWISQASAKQRAGRAGRVCAGTVYRLYTRRFFEDVMPRYDTPEMLRLSLDSVVLKVKLLGIKTPVDADGNLILDEGSSGAPGAAAGKKGKAAADGAGEPVAYVNSAKGVLSRSLQAPDASNVDVATQRLAALGALTSDHDSAEVTGFGKLLSSFPGDIALGRLVSFGLATDCLPDAIVLAGAMAAQDPFMVPHMLQSDSLEEYLCTVAKVTRSRWMFGVDSVAGADGSETDFNPPACTYDPLPPGAPEPKGLNPRIALLRKLVPKTRDGVTGDPVHPYAGAGRGSWSDAITIRNVYIAWRCVRPQDRLSWCFSHGLIARRVQAIHSLVREIAQRVARDHPDSGGTIRKLLAAGREDTLAGDGDAAGSAASAKRWPPEGLFTTNTHVLRAIMLAGLVSNLFVGTPVMGELAFSGPAMGVDALRTGVFSLKKETPDAWVTAAGVQIPVPAQYLEASRIARRNELSEPLLTQPIVKDRAYHGTLVRSLCAIGYPVEGITNVMHLRPGKRVAVEFAGDWNTAPVASMAGMHQRNDAKSHNGAAALTPGFLPIPLQRLLSLPGYAADTGDDDGEGGGDPEELHLVETFCVSGSPGSNAALTRAAREPVAFGPPVYLAALAAAAASASSKLLLPYVEDKTGMDPAGGRTARVVPGAAPPRGAKGGAGDHDDDGGMPSLPDIVELSAPGLLGSVKWKLTDACSGASIFTAGSGEGEEDPYEDDGGYGGKKKGGKPKPKASSSGIPTHVAARSRSSLVTMAMPVTLPFQRDAATKRALAAAATREAGRGGAGSAGGDATDAAALAQRLAAQAKAKALKASKKGGKGLDEEDAATVELVESAMNQNPSLGEGPFLGVCSTWQLIENRNGLNVELAYPTLLWHDPTTTALALLVFSRGIKVTLHVSTRFIPADAEKARAVYERAVRTSKPAPSSRPALFSASRSAASAPPDFLGALGLLDDAVPSDPTKPTPLAPGAVPETVVPFIVGVSFGVGSTASPLHITGTRISFRDLAIVNQLRADYSTALMTPDISLGASGAAGAAGGADDMPGSRRGRGGAPGRREVRGPNWESATGWADKWTSPAGGSRFAASLQDRLMRLLRFHEDEAVRRREAAMSAPGPLFSVGSVTVTDFPDSAEVQQAEMEGDVEAAAKARTAAITTLGSTMLPPLVSPLGEQDFGAFVMAHNAGKALWRDSDDEAVIAFACDVASIATPSVGLTPAQIVECEMHGAFGKAAGDKALAVLWRSHETDVIGAYLRGRVRARGLKVTYRPPLVVPVTLQPPEPVAALLDRTGVAARRGGASASGSRAAAAAAAAAPTPAMPAVVKPPPAATLSAFFGNGTKGGKGDAASKAHPGPDTVGVPSQYVPPASAATAVPPPPIHTLWFYHPDMGPFSIPDYQYMSPDPVPEELFFPLGRAVPDPIPASRVLEAFSAGQSAAVTDAQLLEARFALQAAFDRVSKAADALEARLGPATTYLARQRSTLWHVLRSLQAEELPYTPHGMTLAAASAGVCSAAMATTMYERIFTLAALSKLLVPFMTEWRATLSLAMRALQVASAETKTQVSEFTMLWLEASQSRAKLFKMHSTLDKARSMYLDRIAVIVNAENAISMLGNAEFTMEVTRSAEGGRPVTATGARRAFQPTISEPDLTALSSSVMFPAEVHKTLATADALCSWVCVAAAGLSVKGGAALAAMPAAAPPQRRAPAPAPAPPVSAVPVYTSNKKQKAPGGGSGSGGGKAPAPSPPPAARVPPKKASKPDSAPSPAGGKDKGKGKAPPGGAGGPAEDASSKPRKAGGGAGEPATFAPLKLSVDLQATDRDAVRRVVVPDSN